MTFLCATAKCFARHSYRLDVCPSAVGLSDALVICIKTVQAKITKSSAVSYKDSSF